MGDYIAIRPQLPPVIWYDYTPGQDEAEEADLYALIEVDDAAEYVAARRHQWPKVHALLTRYREKEAQ